MLRSPGTPTARRALSPLRLASFARRPEWYFKLVRDHQIKDWGYVKRKKTMTDIVERLRAWNKDSYPHCWEAADEIEQLRADSEQLNKLTVEFNAFTKAADAEIKRLRALSQNNATSWDDIVRERNELRDEITRLQNLILGACNIFCNLNAPHWAAEFRRALANDNEKITGYDVTGLPP